MLTSYNPLTPYPLLKEPLTRFGANDTPASPAKKNPISRRSFLKKLALAAYTGWELSGPLGLGFKYEGGPIYRLIALVVGGGGYDYKTVKEAAIQRVGSKKLTQILDAHGNPERPIFKFDKAEYRYTQLSDIDPKLVLALLSIEDDNFFGHRGVMPLKQWLVTIFQDRGGSTLSQQLIKNVFLTPDEDKWDTLFRKPDEFLKADQLDGDLSKANILEIYLNAVYFGDGAFGIHSACKKYFNKSPKDLTLEECALLAGVLNAPGAYNPRDEKKYELAKQRRNQVLDAIAKRGKGVANAMAEHKLPNVDLNDLLGQVKLAASRKTTQIALSGNSANNAPNFIDYAQEQAKQILREQKRITDNKDTSLEQLGLTITTTLDEDVQKIAQDTVQKISAKAGRTKENEQAALMSVNSEGKIIAYVGGINESLQDGVSDAKRQPGSCIKPIIYATALNDPKYDIHPTSVYKDEPDGKRKWGKNYYNWAPYNSYESDLRYMTLARALRISNNVIPINIVERIGPNVFAKKAEEMGVHLPDAYKPDSQMAIGGGGLSVSLNDMVMAYSAIANNGILRSPMINVDVFNDKGEKTGNQKQPLVITKIQDKSGKTIFSMPGANNTPVIKPKTRDSLVYMMQDVVTNGTGTRAEYGKPIAGKTGTTDNNVDAWFIGFNDAGITTGIRIGNIDASPMKPYIENGTQLDIGGGTLPAKTWREFMRQIGGGPSKRFDTSQRYVDKVDRDYWTVYFNHPERFKDSPPKQQNEEPSDSPQPSNTPSSSPKPSNSSSPSPSETPKEPSPSPSEPQPSSPPTTPEPPTSTTPPSPTPTEPTPTETTTPPSSEPPTIEPTATEPVTLSFGKKYRQRLNLMS